MSATVSSDHRARVSFRALALFVSTLASAVSAQTTERVSVATGGTQGNGPSSTLAVLTPDGRYVAFYSEATNLVSGDTNGMYDLFIRGPLPSPWTNLGGGLAGITGVPNLFGAGTLVAGSAGSLTLSSARSSSTAVLFVSLASTPTPLQCGLLTPFPFALALSLPTDASGTLQLPWPAWPAGVSGLSFYFQYVLADPAAICGASFSNALRGDAP
jgi:hypothetical protein